MTLPRVVVLFSGGLDSTTCVAIAAARGFEPVLLSIRYGQQHDSALQANVEMRRKYGVRETRLLVLPDIGNQTSSLVSLSHAVPKGGDPRAPGIPNTYVPARNLIFLSYAASLCEELGAKDIYIGVNQLDSSGYPDCRDQFITAFETAMNLGTKAGVEGYYIKIHRPLVEMTKAEIITTGMELGVDYAWTSSCYDPKEVHEEFDDGKGCTIDVACGTCDSCQLRLEGFASVGIKDPLSYPLLND